MPSSREVVERYARSPEAADLDAQDALLHEDVVTVLPQSGERFVGRANRRAMIENYPGSAENPITGTVGQIVGRDEQWVMGPSFNITYITAYFGQPFDPPAWRSQWVEREDAGE